jgi:predicted NAD-dependent protein-ADP-ribosyltransferase YbiA (DUF1768 family)
MEFSNDGSSSVFMFFSGSADCKAGKGTKEFLKSDEDSQGTYSELNKIKNWRKVLSAFHVCETPFEYNGQTYWTQEHAYHASKFPQHPEFAQLFCSNSNSGWEKDPATAKSMGGKSGKAKRRNIFRPKNVTMDKSFNSKKSFIRKGIMRAKYTSNKLCKDVLLATKKAILTHWTRGVPQHVDTDLMDIRDGLALNK